MSGNYRDIGNYGIDVTSNDEAPELADELDADGIEEVNMGIIVHD